MIKILESLIVFGVVLGVWVLFALVVMTLASFIPGEELVTFVGGEVSMLGLLAALGIASRIVGRRVSRFYS